MLNKQIIEYQLRGPGAPWPYMYYDWLTSWQNKNPEGKSSSGYYLLLKYCWRQYA